MSIQFNNIDSEATREIDIQQIDKLQRNWEFVTPTGIPDGYQSDKCQYECGGPWNKQCDDPVWYECRYIEGIGNRCVGKIDIEDFELTIDEDQEILFDLIIKDATNMHNANKDNPNAKIILQQSQYDPSGAIKNITTLKDPKKREIIADASGYKRYSDTGERVFPDVVKEIPKGATIEGLTEALASIDRELMIYRSSMTPEDVLDKERRREAIRNELENLTIGNQIGGLTIPPSGSSIAESTRARLPGMNQAPAASTKIKITGF